VTVDGRPVALAGPSPGRILALHKPFGVVTTLYDPQGRPTVRDLLPRDRRWLPVGRLDLASEGLLLCTDDIALVHAIAHPSHGLRKRYRVWVEPKPTDAQLYALTHGMVVESRVVRARDASRVDPAKAEAGLWLDPRRRVRSAGGVLDITLVEGRNREIRRMCTACGLRVRRLVRIAVGPVRLTGLRPGRYRYLTERETYAVVADRREGLSARPDAHALPVLRDTE